MKKIELSDIEKRILRDLSVIQYDAGAGILSDLSREELSVASSRLKGYGLIVAHFMEGQILAFARITDEGIVYLRENPTLENPAPDNELKRLQIDDLEYRKRIRKMEDVIRLWKFACAIIGLIGTVGWLLFVFKNFINE
ncbi:MAG: hypothetical protein LBC68_13480 [Prevotellaceae bacterium]|jgi:hypothetical protein|nr:hypothetical protein [Prevotellaceae bacterium]